MGPQFFVDVQGWLYGGATPKLKGIAAGMDPLNLVAVIAVAAAFGLVHALMPDHGKTVVASYYLGRPATVLSGLCTSVILVFTHVGSAIALVLAGIIVIRHTLGGAGRAPELETMSAAAIIVIGLWLLYRAVRGHDHARDGADSRLPSECEVHHTRPADLVLAIWAQNAYFGSFLSRKRYLPGSGEPSSRRQRVAPAGHNRRVLSSPVPFLRQRLGDVV